LNSRRSTIAWIASIALLAIFAGLSWLNLELSPEAGAQKFEISGFQVFPIISALLLLQVAALLASLLTPKMISRVISGILSPIMLAHGVFVVVGLQSSLQSAIEEQITEITGVAGFASQAEFVAFAGDTYLWVGYLLAISLNLAILLTKSLSKGAHSEARPKKEALVAEQDLWETQK
jgi:hypothetical protein